MVAGRADLLAVNESVREAHYKTENIDLTPVILPAAQLRPGAAQRCLVKQDHGLETCLDNMFIEAAAPALPNDASVTPQPVQITCAINNQHRATGTMLSYEVCAAFYLGVSLLDVCDLLGLIC